MEKVLSLVNEFRSKQEPNGAVIEGQTTKAETLLRALLPMVEKITNETGQPLFFQGFQQDVLRWIELGLETIPDFSATRDSFVKPENGEKIFFIGVVKSQNSYTSQGYTLDCFLCLRNEPQECQPLYERYPHPKNVCQSTQLIFGSEGIADGNCVVFFPENIVSPTKITQQQYALFFFNKFYKIYSEQTLINTRNVVLNTDELAANRLWSDFGSYSENDIYISRCVWGYLHDYFHHSGFKPFDENIKLKMNWFVGLLEEIKVDLQSYLICRTDPSVPFGELVSQYILFDRMFRYPFQSDYQTNFDSGTGILLFNYLFRSGCIRKENERLIIDVSLLDKMAQLLIDEIIEIETLSDDQEIKNKAQNLVNRYMTVSDSRKVDDVLEYKNVFAMNEFIS